MKRMITMFAGLTILGTAALAQARPLNIGPRLRVQSAARHISDNIGLLMQTANNSPRGSRFMNVQPLQKLQGAANRFRNASEGADVARLQKTFARLQQRFSEASQALPWLHRCNMLSVQFANIGREISAVAPFISALAAYPSFTPNLTPAYASPPVPPPVPQPTVVYTTPGATVSWYRTR